MPVHDDRLLFEYLILEGAQAGLSWRTVLNKRENYRAAFDHFDAEKIARYGVQGNCPTDRTNAGIIRNRLKIHATIQNAKSFLQSAGGIRQFRCISLAVRGWPPIINRRQSMPEVPARTEISDAMSKDLFRNADSSLSVRRFVTRTCRPSGMVNDHLVTCFRHWELSGKAGKRMI